MTTGHSAAVAALLMAVLLGSAPAAYADDIFEIDERLIDAGFDEAYTEVIPAARGDGVRVLVDFDSDSQDQGTYAQEAGRIVEVIWNHLDGRVLAVDVISTSAVDWAPQSLPPSVSFTAAQLRAEFGPRPTALDEAEIDPFEGFVDPFAGPDPFLLGVAFFGWVVSIVVTAGVTALVMSRRRPSVDAWAPAGPWQQPGPWQSGPWQQPGPWQQQPGPWQQPAPASTQVAPSPFAPPASQERPPDPWSSPRS